MGLPQLLREIEDRGVTLMAAPVEPRLRFRPASLLTPELVEGLREHKAEILEALLAGPRVRDVGEVLELARARLGEIAPEHREDPPIPAPEKGRDPLVHEYTDKARFFRGVRLGDLAKREREGLPTWIRMGGAGGVA